jgi:type VI secretion system protein ImpK
MDRVNWVTKDCFNAIGRLAQLGPQDRVQPELVHGRLRGLVDGMQRKAREAGYGEQDARAMAYALVALADETVLAHAGPLRDFWATQPLQLAYFGENTAGENFFVQLEQVRADAQRTDVLRVFYLCLLLGFQGRYGVRGAEVALSDLIESVRVQLTRALPMPEVLAPHGPRPEEGVIDSSRRFPIVWTALGLLALSSVLYLGLVVSLHERLVQFAAWMDSVTGGS